MGTANLLSAPPPQTPPRSPVGPATSTGCEGSRGSWLPPRLRPARTHCSPLPGASPPPQQRRAVPGCPWGGVESPRPLVQGWAPLDAGTMSGLPDATYRHLSQVGGGLKGLRTAPAPTGHPLLHVHWFHCAHQALAYGRAKPGLWCRAVPSTAKQSQMELNQ